MSAQIAKNLIATAFLAVACMAAVPAAAQQRNAPPIAQRTFTDNVLSFAELEKRAQAEIADIREMEVRDLLLKVEGYDNEGRKVKITMDRRSGAVLSHQIKYSKHSRRYQDR